MNNYTKNARPVNLLPLMDVIFLVLAVFFYLMLFMIKHEGVPVELPASSFSKVDKKPFVSITLSNSNQLFFNKELLLWNDLDDKILQVKNIHKGELVMYISADKKSQHEFFVKILDSLRRHNITNVNIETSDSK